MRGVGGSGSIEFDNVLTRGFKEGIRLEGTANTDIHLYKGWVLRDVKTGYIINNPQSVIHDFVGCDVVTAGAGGDVFYIQTGGEISVFGGSYVVLGPDNLLRFPPTFSGR